MKHLTLTTLCAFLSVSPLLAAPVTVSFEATVNYLEDDSGYLTEKLAVGSVITGKYTYDPDQADSNEWEVVGDYDYAAAPYGVSLNLANILVGTKPGGYFLIETVNDYPDYGGDNFLFRSYENKSSDKELSVDHISWQLDDPTGTALSSDALPAGPPPIEDFESWFGLEVTNDGLHLQAEVTKVVVGDSLFRPIISILPASGQLLDTQSFEPVIKVDTPVSPDVSITKILLDGTDVTQHFLKKAKQGVINGDTPGMTWRFKDLKLTAGNHTVQTYFAFGDGNTSSATVKWEVLDASEGD
jgi:hypothetical protein